MFDARKFLDDEFDTPTALLRFVKSYGMSPPKFQTASQWFARRSVPGDWLCVLLALLELEHGQPVSLQPYFTRPK